MGDRESLKLLIVAGEESGDLHGGELIRAICAYAPDTEFFGIGGDNMCSAGMECIYHIKEVAVSGFFEVLKSIGPIREAFRKLKKLAEECKPHGAILIDYPGFNLRFAKVLKSYGIPVVYYISPQIWAWGEGRIKLIRELVDKMIVIFDFEKELYERAGVDVEFVGHPLVDIVKVKKGRAEIFEKAGLEEKFTVSLMPGSRKNEVVLILPIMLEGARILQKRFPDVQFVCIRASTVERQFLEAIMDRQGFPVKIFDKDGYDLIGAADLAFVAAGSATLELALLGVPMIIVHRLPSLTYRIAKRVVKLDKVGLVNIVAGRKVVREFIQNEATPQNLAKEAEKLILDGDYRDRVLKDLADVRAKLGAPGAPRRAAECILEFLRKEG